MRIGRLSKLISLSLLSPFLVISSSVHSSSAQEKNIEPLPSVIEIYQSSGEVILRDGGDKSIKIYAKTARPDKKLPAGNYTIHTDSLPKCETGSDGSCLTNEFGYYYPAKYVMYKGKKYVTQVTDLASWGKRSRVLYAPIFLGKYNSDGSIRIFDPSPDGVPAIHSDITDCTPAALDWYAQSSNPINYYGNWDGKTISVSPSGHRCLPPPKNLTPANVTFGCIRMKLKDHNKTYDFIYRSWQNNHKIDVRIFK